MPKKDTLDPKDMAAMYGWAMSVLRSDKSLYNAFQRAVKNGWGTERFVAEVRNTPWFKHNSDAMRAATILKNTDPKTWRARAASTRATISDMAAAMGAQLSTKMLDRITGNVLNFGWNDSQIQNVLAGAVKPNSKGVYAGKAALNIDHVRETAANYGVKLSESGLESWAARMAAGEDVASFDATIKSLAAGSFPGWADEIKAGKSVRELADPYINQMANTLEINPNDIDLSDTTLRKAIQFKDPETNKVGAAPLWQAESIWRQDVRYDKTKQAIGEATDLANGFRQMFTGA